MIQAWWRGIRQRKQYHKLLKEKELNALHHNQLLNAKTNHKNNKLHQNKLSNIKENNKNDKLNRYKKQVYNHIQYIVETQTLLRI